LLVVQREFIKFKKELLVFHREMLISRVTIKKNRQEFENQKIFFKNDDEYKKF
jgi:hypothetical protein